jgi:hypothetical protein
MWTKPWTGCRKWTKSTVSFPRNTRSRILKEDLFKQGILGVPTAGGPTELTGKAERLIRERALEQVFGKLKKSDRGSHGLRRVGQGDETTSDRRAYRFGDALEQVAMSDSIRNAQQRGIDELRMSEDDLEVVETENQSACATVLMIDISHSMILYGEDRITPAKKVAMALAELIARRYPKDTLDIVVFGNDAWQVSLKDLPYLQVGPFHTNTVAGLELAMDILRRRKLKNRRIVMITDGKPSCIKRERRVLHEQLRPGRNHRGPHAGCRHARAESKDPHHHVHDRAGPVFATLHRALHRSKPRTRLLHGPARLGGYGVPRSCGEQKSILNIAFNLAVKTKDLSV